PRTGDDLRHPNPLSDVCLAPSADAGIGSNGDFHGARQDGFGYYQVTQKGGARCSTAAGYLTPARGRSNLTVVTGALARRVLLDGARAVGVEYSHRGSVVRAEAAREVLLCGGALNSPQLLLLSGIGPADDLRRHGIAMAAESPEVGANLHDHLDACTIHRCSRDVTYDHTNDLAVAWEYYLHRRGIGTSNVAESGGFVRSDLAPDERPDIQFHFVPAMLEDHGRQRLPGHGYTLHACALRPLSRGRVALASADPAAKVRIHANYLGDPQGFDLRVLIEAVRLSRRILQQPAFRDWQAGEIFPGEDARDDAALADFVRRKAETIYHPVGTCRMGADARAVVDPQLRVNGVAALRVVDASVMPRLIGGNTNAPTVMIAERAGDLVLAA
ncbi:MAG: GMC family oxidoreductase, partial [Pseudomonadota bacterium]